LQKLTFLQMEECPCMPCRESIMCSLTFPLKSDVMVAWQNFKVFGYHCFSFPASLPSRPHIERLPEPEVILMYLNVPQVHRFHPSCFP